jgi:hypothetical protein
MSARITRRSMLGGLVIGGSVAVWPQTMAIAEGGAPGPFGTPRTSGGANQPMVFTPAKPGYHYVRCSPASFTPESSTTGYTLNGANLRPTAGFPTFFSPFAPPHGSTIKEIEVYLDPGPGAALFAILVVDAAFNLTDVGLSNATPGPGIKTTTVSVDLPVDLLANSYEFAIAFSAPGTLYGARIGSIAPTGLITVPQVRKLDTRTGAKPAVNSITTVDLAPQVPAGARAALVNLTATNTVNGGFVTAFPGSLSTPPDTSVLNWTVSNTDIANGAVVELGGGTTIKLFVGGSPGTATHLLCDVTGYYI